MICRCELCLYERDGKCTAKDIEIDRLGRCKTVLLMQVEREYTDLVKAKLSQKVTCYNYDRNEKKDQR